MELKMRYVVGVVTQWLKPSFKTLLFYFGVLILVLAAPLPIQFPAMPLGRKGKIRNFETSVET